MSFSIFTCSSLTAGLCEWTNFLIKIAFLLLQGIQIPGPDLLYCVLNLFKYYVTDGFFVTVEFFSLKALCMHHLKNLCFGFLEPLECNNTSRNKVSKILQYEIPLFAYCHCNCWLSPVMCHIDHHSSSCSGEGVENGDCSCVPAGCAGQWPLSWTWLLVVKVQNPE